MAKSQRLLESLDALIAASRKGVILDQATRTALCDDVCMIRESYARLVAEYNQRNSIRPERKRDARAIAEAMWQDIRR